MKYLRADLTRSYDRRDNISRHPLPPVRPENRRHGARCGTHPRPGPASNLYRLCHRTIQAGLSTCAQHGRRGWSACRTDRTRIWWRRADNLPHLYNGQPCPHVHDRVEQHHGAWHLHYCFLGGGHGAAVAILDPSDDEEPFLFEHCLLVVPCRLPYRLTPTDFP